MACHYKEYTKFLQNASSHTSKLVRNGILKNIHKRKCVKCGKPADVYHHTTYKDLDNPNTVTPMCYSCHRLLHEAMNPPVSQHGNITIRRYVKIHP